MDTMDTRGIVFNIQKFCLHDGPGIRTTAFLKGCPLRCQWCANPESQQQGIERDTEGTVYGEEKTVAQVMDAILQDVPFYEESGGGVTLSGGEPLGQIDFACALLGACKDRGIATAVETTGAVAPEALGRAAPLTDLFLFDVKHHDRQRHKAGTGVDNALILENLRWLIEGGHRVQVRIPVIPGFNGSLGDARAFGQLLGGMGAKDVELLPFHQFGEKKYTLLGKAYAFNGKPAMNREDLIEYRKVLDGWLEKAHPRFTLA